MESHPISPEAVEFAGLQRVNYLKLPWEEKITIIWGWFWRVFLVLIGTGGAIGIFLFIFTIFLFRIASDLNPVSYLIIFWSLYLGFGIIITHPIVQWILSARIGSYRIILCKRRISDDITLDEGPLRKTIGI